MGRETETSGSSSTGGWTREDPERMESRTEGDCSWIERGRILKQKEGRRESKSFCGIIILERGRKGWGGGR